jgi:lipopolysaccharide biosynthesis protein
MKVNLFHPAGGRLQHACGIIHFEGELLHEEDAPPSCVFLRIGRRTVRLRRIKQSKDKTFFLGRFTMRTGLKLLQLYTSDANGVSVCHWRGLMSYVKKEQPTSEPLISTLAPPPLRPIVRVESLEPPRVAVILHLYYADLWSELAAYISQITEAFDFYVTIPQESPLAVQNDILHHFPFVKITKVENRGRDILPFLKIFRELPVGRYAYICKIHSKKTLARWWTDGDFWRYNLLTDILGKPKTVADILNRFQTNPSLGLVAAWRSLHSYPPKTLDPNQEIVRELATRMGRVENENESFTFPAGSMFWARAEALEPLRRAAIRADEFPEEAGFDDGTLAHAIERAFGLSAKLAGFVCKETSEIRNDN